MIPWLELEKFEMKWSYFLIYLQIHFQSQKWPVLADSMAKWSTNFPFFFIELHREAIVLIFQICKRIFLLWGELYSQWNKLEVKVKAIRDCYFDYLELVHMSEWINKTWKYILFHVNVENPFLVCSYWNDE